jgi:hypothetical protein
MTIVYEVEASLQTSDSIMILGHSGEADESLPPGANVVKHRDRGNLLVT